jgi:hypothetical protein
VSINIDADDLIRKITTLQELRRVKAAMKMAGVFLRGKMATYPARRFGPNPGLRGKSEKAAKMRRGFFAKLRSGEIEVPYRRGISPGSETLGRRWTVTQSGDGMTVTIGNNASYAQLVQSADKQTQYHKTTGWLTEQEAEERHGDEVVRYVREAIAETLNE